MPVPEFAFSPKDLHLSPSSSPFDRALQTTWLDHMSRGHFRYDFRSPDSRLLAGRFGFVAQLNPGRASNRRPPHPMTHLEQPFNPDTFNFTKIDEDKEAVFRLKDADHEGLVIINVSPLEFCSSLLVPRVKDRLPQILTEDSIALAVKTVLLSSDVSFKAAFNSLCAYASVNHQHWHLYYLQSHRLKLEIVGAKHLQGDCYVIDEEDYPAAGFAFQVKRAEDVDGVSRSIHRLTRFLTDENIAHNVFITRGISFEDETSALRVFVWARENVVGSRVPDAFIIAGCELAGQVLCYTQEVYERLEEGTVVKAMGEACKEVFDGVRERVKRLFEEAEGA